MCSYSGGSTGGGWLWRLQPPPPPPHPPCLAQKEPVSIYKLKKLRGEGSQTPPPPQPFLQNWTRACGYASQENNSERYLCLYLKAPYNPGTPTAITYSSYNYESNCQ